MDNVIEQFRQLLLGRGLELSELQANQFETYYRELTAWNEKMNLTGITEREQVYIKHFYDSISLAFFVPLTSIRSLADIGSGAGFPSIPLKIMFPHLKVTIVDSLNKRIQFLQHLKESLHLDLVQCLHGRAEDLARKTDFRDAFDLVTARAVARLNVLNEFCLPFTAKDGLFVAMKGTDPKEELKEAAYSMKQLHARLEKVYSFELPIDQSQRHIIVVRKINNTPPKYPRKAGVPLKAPLV
jgi:16S rRNA (guanine527-N7)-methyltransferase